MIERASTARGSNDPHPPTAMDKNKDAKYWHRTTKPYILEQMIISGFDPPHPMGITEI